MKLSAFILGLIFSSQCFAWVAASGVDDSNVCSGREGVMACLALSPVTTTSAPTMFVLDSGEEVSVADRLPELEAEINAGPENYYYLRAAAKTLADKKYNGDTDKALSDVIAQVKALVEIQKSSSAQDN